MNTEDRRAKRSRRLLLEAFRALLTEKTFDAITVQDVSERADVNRGTFYAHFPDKYALLEQVVGESFEQALLDRVPMEAPFTGENLEQLTTGVLEFLGTFVGHCRPSDRTLRPLVETSMREALCKRLLDWMETSPKCAETGVPPDVAATAMSWTIFGSGLDWAQSDRTVVAADRARQILALTASGPAETIER